MPGALPHPRIHKFRELYAESKTRAIKTLKDHLEWIEHMEGKLGGSDAVVDQYFEWEASQDPVPKYKSSDKVPLSDLRSFLSTADWKEGNESLASLNTVLWHLSGSASSRDIQAMAWTDTDFVLGLQIGGSLLVPPIDADVQTCAAQGIDTIAPGWVLGMRYASNDDPPQERRLLLAPLGRICYTPMDSQGRSPWLLCELILAAEIREDGKAGDLVIITTPSEDDARETTSLPPGLQHAGPFTVARLDGPSFGVLDESATSNGPQQSMERALKVESISKPEIVQVGVRLVELERKPGERPLPVCLFPN